MAKNPVIVPGGVEVTLGGDEITVKGALGNLTQRQSKFVSVTHKDSHLQCSAIGETREAAAMVGTMHALLSNMVKGVSQGFERKLTLVGVGYRAQAKGEVLGLSLGFSHPIEHKMPTGVKVETPTQTEIVLKGADKQRVGQVAAEIRAYRRPEPYKGKGVRYADEVVTIKETKKK